MAVFIAIFVLATTTATNGLADAYTWRGFRDRWEDVNHWDPKGSPNSPQDALDITRTGWADLELNTQVTVNAITMFNTTIHAGRTGNGLTLAGERPTIAVRGDANSRCNINVPFSGTEPWTKTGEGVLVLSGINDFTGECTVVEGQLAIQNPASVGGSPPITMRDGAQLGIYASGSFGDPITLNGGVGQLGALFLNKDEATYTLTGPITVNSATQIAAYGERDTINLNGAIGGTGDLTVSGGNQGGRDLEHTFNLNANETFSGKLSLTSQGPTDTHFSLKAGNDTLPKNCDLDLSAQNVRNKRRTVELNINGTQEDLGTITTSSDGTAMIDDKSDAADGTINAKTIHISGSAPLLLNVNGVTLSGKVGISLLNGGEVVFHGSEMNVKGQVVLAPRGEPASRLIINDGALNVDGDILMGEGNGAEGLLAIRNGTANAHSIELGNGGSGMLDLSGGKLLADRLYTGSNGIVNFNNGTLEVASANCASPFVDPNVSLNVMNGGATIDTHGVDAMIAGTIHSFNNSRGNFTKTGAGTLTCSGQNNLSGKTNINGGALAIPVGSSLTSNVAVNLAGGMLVLNGGTASTEVIDTSSAGAINFDGGRLQVSDGNVASPFVRPGVKLNIGTGGATINTNTYDAVLAEPLLRAGSDSMGGFTKSGGGTLTLHGSNTYVGPTEITGGTLALAADASITNSSLVDLAAGATLDVSAVNEGCALAQNQIVSGCGTVAGDVTVHGTIQPRQPNSVATLSFRNRLGLSGATISIRVDGQGGLDQITVNGSAAVEGSCVIDPTFLAGAAQPGTYDIIDAPNGNLTGKFTFRNGQDHQTTRLGSTNYLLTLSNSNAKEQLTIAVSQ
jgi:autotransporter-associated beta strand protein